MSASGLSEHLGHRPRDGHRLLIEGVLQIIGAVIGLMVPAIVGVEDDGVVLLIEAVIRQSLAARQGHAPWRQGARDGGRRLSDDVPSLAGLQRRHRLLEALDEGRGGGRAPLSIAGHRVEDQLLQPHGGIRLDDVIDGRGEAVERGRIFGAGVDDHLGVGAVRVGRLPGDHLVEDDPQGVDVYAGINRLLVLLDRAHPGALEHPAGHLLWGEVARGAAQRQGVSGVFAAGAREIFDQPQVHEGEAAVLAGVEDDVGGLEIAVHQPAIVEGV